MIHRVPRERRLRSLLQDLLEHGPGLVVTIQLHQDLPGLEEAVQAMRTVVALVDQTAEGLQGAITITLALLREAQLEQRIIRAGLIEAERQIVTHVLLGPGPAVALEFAVTGGQQPRPVALLGVASVDDAFQPRPRIAETLLPVQRHPQAKTREPRLLVIWMAPQEGLVPRHCRFVILQEIGVLRRQQIDRRTQLVAGIAPVKRLAAGEALAVPALLMVRRGLELQGVGGEVVLR